MENNTETPTIPVIPEERVNVSLFKVLVALVAVVLNGYTSYLVTQSVESVYFEQSSSAMFFVFQSTIGLPILMMAVACVKDSWRNLNVFFNVIIIASLLSMLLNLQPILASVV